MLNNIKKNFHELYEIIVVSKTIFYICSALIAIIFFTIRYTGFNFNFLDHESMICKNEFLSLYNHSCFFCILFNLP